MKKRPGLTRRFLFCDVPGAWWTDPVGGHWIIDIVRTYQHTRIWSASNLTMVPRKLLCLLYHVNYHIKSIIDVSCSTVLNRLGKFMLFSWTSGSALNMFILRYKNIVVGRLVAWSGISVQFRIFPSGLCFASPWAPIITTIVDSEIDCLFWFITLSLLSVKSLFSYPVRLGSHLNRRTRGQHRVENGRISISSRFYQQNLNSRLL